MTDVNDNVPLNAGLGGATIATDYQESAGVSAHYQIVKIAHGADGSTPEDIKRTRPLPVTIEQLNSIYSNAFVAVAGSTNGTSPIAITGDVSVSVGTVGVSGGTLSSIFHGVSADIRSCHSDVKIGVHTITGDTVAVTGNVDVGNQVDVNIVSIDLPTAVFSGVETANTEPSIIGTQVCKTGVRVKNTGFTACFLSTNYRLDSGENIFLEVSNVNAVKAYTIEDTTTVCWIAT